MPKAIPVAPPGPPGSLAAALAAVPDPRHPRGWRPDRAPLPVIGILQLAVAAMLCGCRSLYAVAQWGQERLAEDPQALVVLGLPPGRSPSHPTLHRVFAALDVAAFERALGQWLIAGGVDPAEAVALDGKTLRGIQGDTVPGVHLVAAFAHRAGVVLAEAPSPGKGQELAAVKTVLGNAAVTGRTVTGDALLTQRDLCLQIVAGGGAYLLPVDDNQPALLAAVEAAFSPLDGDRSGRVGTAGDRSVAGRRAGRAGRGDDGGAGG
jgi:DDE_Tnp_1-associated